MLTLMFVTRSATTAKTRHALLEPDRVPVMVGGIVLGGKSYKPSEYLQVSLCGPPILVWQLPCIAYHGARF